MKIRADGADIVRKVMREHHGADIVRKVMREHHGAQGALKRARANVPFLKREIWPFQAAALYALARPYNKWGNHILEIGTAWGYSCAIMAEACPEADITTLNPKQHEYERAVGHLAPYGNVRLIKELSWVYLAHYGGPKLDLVFVDGDHSRVREDFPWWNWVRNGGLMLFHDYSPGESKRPCEPVYDAVNEFGEWLGRKPDVLVIDYREVGMAGFVKDPLDKELK